MQMDFMQLFLLIGDYDSVLFSSQVSCYEASRSIGAVFLDRKIRLNKPKLIVSVDVNQ